MVLSNIKAKDTYHRRYRVIHTEYVFRVGVITCPQDENHVGLAPKLAGLLFGSLDLYYTVPKSPATAVAYLILSLSAQI
jgi:hypothetical protein